MKNNMRDLKDLRDETKNNVKAKQKILNKNENKTKQCKTKTHDTHKSGKRMKDEIKKYIKEKQHEIFKR